MNSKLKFTMSIVQIIDRKHLDALFFWSFYQNLDIPILNDNRCYKYELKWHAHNDRHSFYYIVSDM